MTTAGDRDAQDRGPGPYVGPRPFRQSDSGRFFARQLEARDVAALWMADRITVLHGPSAVGKSSLLQAGILPLLGRETGARLLPVSGLGRPPARPLAVPPPFNGYSFTLLSHWAPSGQPPPPGTSIPGFLRECFPASPAGDGDATLLAAVDQFDVLFTEFPARERERTEFLDELGAALRELPALNLLLVVSDDHLATLSSHEKRLSPDPVSYIRLDALTPATALQAVTRPLEATGWSFGPGVAEDLVGRLRTVVYTDLAGESATVVSDLVEPLFLQIVCAELWASLHGEEGIISASDLRALGDVDQRLAGFYDAAVSAVQLETGEPETTIREWIESVFITEHGTRGTACRGLLTTAGMPNLVADALAQHLVLTTEYRARGTWYQLSQDRMISPIRAANRSRRSALGLTAVQPAGSATPEALSAAAEAALAEGNIPSARRFADAAALRYRESGNTRRLGYALALQADVARAEGDLHAAAEHLHGALSLFTLLEDRNLIARTLSVLADISFEGGDYRDAARYQREAVENLPSDVDALVGLAYAQWYGGAPADAEATFSQAIGWDPKAARAFGGRGQVLAEMNEFPAALISLDAALGLGMPPAEEIDVHSARALALTALGRDEEADQALATARGQDPARARTMRRAARIAAIRGEPMTAEQEAERALRADPPLPPWDEADARRLLAALSARGA